MVPVPSLDCYLPIRLRVVLVWYVKDTSIWWKKQEVQMQIVPKFINLSDCWICLRDTHQSFIYFHLHRLYQSSRAGSYIIFKVSACLVYWFRAHYRGILLLHWVITFHAHNLICTEFWLLKRRSMVLDSAILESGWYILWNIWKFTGGFIAKWNGSKNWVLRVLEWKCELR